MTQQDILTAALRQSAIDSNCHPQDFLAPEGRVVLSRPHPEARRYLALPFVCDLTSYGNGVVASVAPALLDDVSDYLRRYRPEHCFETPNLHVLMERLRPHGADICFMAEYFLPDLTALRPLSSPFEMRLLGPEDLAPLRLPAWGNALSPDRPHLDRLAVGAYDGDTLVGLAGCSADCDTMWQIGVDVQPTHRRRGVASALTARLALEILARDKVPFYCCAWSNLASARNAIRSGLRPAWVQVTAKSKAFIDRMNREPPER